MGSDFLCHDGVNLVTERWLTHFYPYLHPYPNLAPAPFSYTSSEQRMDEPKNKIRNPVQVQVQEED